MFDSDWDFFGEELKTQPEEEERLPSIPAFALPVAEPTSPWVPPELLELGALPQVLQNLPPPRPPERRLPISIRRPSVQVERQKDEEKTAHEIEALLFSNELKEKKAEAPRPNEAKNVPPSELLTYSHRRYPPKRQQTMEQKERQTKKRPRRRQCKIHKIGGDTQTWSIVCRFYHILDELPDKLVALAGGMRFLLNTIGARGGWVERTGFSQPWYADTVYTNQQRQPLVLPFDSGRSREARSNILLPFALHESANEHFALLPAVNIPLNTSMTWEPCQATSFALKRFQKVRYYGKPLYFNDGRHLRIGADLTAFFGIDGMDAEAQGQALNMNPEKRKQQFSYTVHVISTTKSPSEVVETILGTLQEYENWLFVTDRISVKKLDEKILQTRTRIYQGIPVDWPRLLRDVAYGNFEGWKTYGSTLGEYEMWVEETDKPSFPPTSSREESIEMYIPASISFRKGQNNVTLYRPGKRQLVVKSDENFETVAQDFENSIQEYYEKGCEGATVGPSPAAPPSPSLASQSLLAPLVSALRAPEAPRPAKRQLRMFQN